jgi:ATP-dependent RNA helicase DeaD
MLMATGADPIDVAAAALKVARADEKQRPIAKMGEVVEFNQSKLGNERGRGGRPERLGRPGSGDLPRRSPRSSHSYEGSRTSHESGMVRLSMNMGKTHGIRPSDVVGALAYHADIPGATIGKIHIQDNQTYVDVPEQFVGQVLDKKTKYTFRKKTFTVELA